MAISFNFFMIIA